MWRTVSNGMAVATLAITTSGCGLLQGITEGTAAAGRAIFYKQVTTLHLDFTGRAALNTDVANMAGLSVPTLVRVYQLRDSAALQRLSYDSLADGAIQALGDDLVNERALLIKPGEGAQLSVPLAQDAQFVAVVAMFRMPDEGADSWRLTLARDELDPDRARVVALGDNHLALRPLVQE